MKLELRAPNDNVESKMSNLMICLFTKICMTLFNVSKFVRQIKIWIQINVPFHLYYFDKWILTHSIRFYRILFILRNENNKLYLKILIVVLINLFHRTIDFPNSIGHSLKTWVMMLGLFSTFPPTFSLSIAFFPT